MHDSEIIKDEKENYTKNMNAIVNNQIESKAFSKMRTVNEINADKTYGVFA